MTLDPKDVIMTLQLALAIAKFILDNKSRNHSSKRKHKKR